MAQKVNFASHQKRARQGNYNGQVGEVMAYVSALNKL